MAQFIYNLTRKVLLQGSIDWENDTIKAMLLNNHTADQDADDFIDDVSAEEVSGTGYTAGGVTLTGKTLTVDTVNDRCYFDSDNPLWASLTLTCDAVVIYKDTGTPGTSPVIAYLEFTEASPSAQPFEIAVPANGWGYV